MITPKCARWTGKSLFKQSSLVLIPPGLWQIKQWVNVLADKRKMQKKKKEEEEKPSACALHCVSKFTGETKVKKYTLGAKTTSILKKADLQ